MRNLYALALGAALLSSGAWAADTAPPAAAAAPDYYVIQLHLDLPEQPTPEQQQALLDHIGHLTELYDQGVLFMAGPFDSGTDGLTIVQAHSLDEARGYEENDPSVKAGVMHITNVQKWWAAYSRPDSRRFTKEQFLQLMHAPPAAKPGASAQPLSTKLTADGGILTMADLPESVVAPEPPQPTGPPDGALVHFELPATDMAQIQDFYGKVFGWKFQAMGEAYVLFETPGGEDGGFTKDRQPGDGGCIFYIYSSDVAAKLAEVKAAGGTVVLDRFGVPGYGWVAVFKDPQGNAVGLFSAKNPPAGASPIPPMPK